MSQFADPIYLGKYPESMLNDFREKIPNFTEDEWRLVKGSSDLSVAPYSLMRGIPADLMASFFS